jgi:hypothetical protein
VIQPHAFKPHKKHKQCIDCGGWADASYHNLELFTDTDLERHQAQQISEAERMTAKMRTPLKDISHAARIIENESPLFGSPNRSLF